MRINLNLTPLEQMEKFTTEKQIRNETEKTFTPLFYNEEELKIHEQYLADLETLGVGKKEKK